MTTIDVTRELAPDLPRLPLVDLGAQHAEIAGEVDVGFAGVIAATAFVGGPAVAAFEAEFAGFCGAPACVGVASGTDAIEMILRSQEIGPGDEVIVPANTFVATVEAVVRSGATPVLVDCDPVHLLIDVGAATNRVSPRTRAVIGVDLYGQIARFDALAAALAALGRPDVVLVEDAAQAHGATRNGRPIASGVVAAATSFYPGKNLGAYGDAGAVVTHSRDVAEAVRSLGNHGGARRYEHRMIGCTSRLDALQAVVLSAKLRRLATWNAARAACAARYDAMLAGLPVVRIPTAAGNRHVWHLYVVRVADRDRVLARLHDVGVDAGVHYPTPVHLTPAFAGLGYALGDFPVAEAASRTILSLPLHPHLTEADQHRVISALEAAL